MNLRERKKARTRAALGEAAIRLFLSRGFDDTTIEDIVAEAGVSRRTFFRYFPSKEAAFFADNAERFQTFSRQVDALLAERSAFGAVSEALLGIASRYAADPRGSLAWHEALEASDALVAQDLQNDQLWEARIRQVFRADGATRYQAAVRAGAVMGVIRAVLAEWYRGGAEGDLTAMGREALDWLGAGAPLADEAVSDR